MYSSEAPLVTLEDLQAAREIQKKSPHVVRTPILPHVQDVFEVDSNIDLYIKCENMQVTGSFKPRGFVTLMSSLPADGGDRKLLTMSAGNAGKTFAYLCQKMGKSGLVVMPETAPANRVDVIQSFGVDVERYPSSELQAAVERHEKEDGMLYLHSFDDIHLIRGHASAGFEILEDVGKPDVVLVCCGGGGLLSGIASAICLSGHTDCKIYGVEPEGSRTMYESYKAGKPVGMSVKSVAAGLSPPFAGPNCYRHCQAHVESILLVSDTELLEAMFLLQRHGLLVEPSGAAAFAALLHRKLPLAPGSKVVVVVTGGNVTPEEMIRYREQLNAANS